MLVNPLPCVAGSKRGSASTFRLAGGAAPNICVNSPFVGAGAGVLNDSSSVNGSEDAGGGASGLLKNIVNSPGREGSMGDSSTGFAGPGVTQESSAKLRGAAGAPTGGSFAGTVLTGGELDRRLPSPKPAKNCSVTEPGAGGGAGAALPVERSCISAGSRKALRGGAGFRAAGGL